MALLGHQRLRQLRPEEYTVGWVCARPIELTAAQEMLDEEHENLEHQNEYDDNTYALGRIGEHNVVIACLPSGLIGNNPAARVVTQMRSTFTSMKFGLLVGIGGGVPSVEVDIRLGDVVVSQPHQEKGGVIQYDFGKATPSGFQRTGFLNSPPTMLLNAVTRAHANHERQRSRLPEHLSKLLRLPKFGRENAGPDILFEATYNHEGGETCQLCRPDKQVMRKPRDGIGPVIHYGTIASGNQVMRNAIERDAVSAEFGGVLCFEMEAAGVMNTFPCLVIRGVCDYADSHKNKKWQPYAAGTAAAFSKEVLSFISPTKVTKVDSASIAQRPNEMDAVVVDSSDESTEDEGDQTNMQCFSCDKYGHLAKNCPRNSCHNCGLQGHYARTCTRRSGNCYKCGLWGHHAKTCWVSK